MNDLLNEIRHALRVHLQRPWMTLAAIVTLGLGIGANTAIFSIVNAVLLKPLPFPDLDRIVKVMPDYEGGGAQPNVSPMQSVYWQERSPFFENFAIFTWQPFSLSLVDAGEAERLEGCRVQRSFFSVFGTQPLVGRAFSPAEDLVGGPPTVIMSHSLWQRRFGGDPQILGRQLRLNGLNHEVIGVMPAIFRYPASADLWLPLQLNPNTQERRNYLTVAAKLGPGIALDAARRDLAAANADWVRDFALPGRKESVAIQPLATHHFGGARQPLTLLGGCATLVLLIACVNVAHLELVRAGDRRLELATRLALGARTSQMIRQLLLESLLLALAGGALALLICRWTYGAVISVVSQSVPVYHDVEIDGTVLSFAVVLAALVGIATGLLPVRAGLRISLADALKGGSVRSLGGGSKHRLVLIAGQVTLTTIALVCALLLVRSYFVLSQRSSGIRSDRVLAMQVALSPGNYGTGEAWEGLSRRMLGDLAQVSGVEHVAAMTNLPLEGGPWATYRVVGRPPDDNGSGAAQCIGVSPSYFDTLGIPLLRGRGFTDVDRRDGAAVVVVNATMAARLWPDSNPIGERVAVLLERGESEESPPREVVGVAGDVLEDGFQEDAPALFYLPMEQFPDSWAEYVAEVRSLGLAVRARGSASVAEPVRDRIQRFDADLPIHGVQPLDVWLSARLQGHRTLMNLAGLLGLLAAALTAVGIYGVLAFLVLQQTREIGLRQAMGADRWMIMRWILGQGMGANWLGLGAGLAAAALVDRWISGFVIVKSLDPVAYGQTAILVSLIGLLAVAIPAYRAVQVQPTDALRSE